MAECFQFRRIHRKASSIALGAFITLCGMTQKLTISASTIYQMKHRQYFQEASTKRLLKLLYIIEKPYKRPSYGVCQINRHGVSDLLVLRT